ncbi:MAG: hypothetical protein PHV98_06180 [Candidatus Omnitrophica bacterium]|nr:hypothetical protein [Candidatus Omnitrophota bacterium]
MSDAVKPRRLIAVRGGHYPSTRAGYLLARMDASLRPGDGRIQWTRFEAGEEIVPPYPELVRSLKLNRLVKEVS